MEVSDHKNKICLIIQLHEPGPVLVIDPEGIKAFIDTFEGFEVEGRMEGIAEK